MDAPRGFPIGLLTAADLAGRAEFRLGQAIVDPARRIVTGPGGSADVEPRVMQVLVVLADAAGEVVTRKALFQSCWGDVYVGDDSLNRVIGALRKIAAEIAGGSFEIETIPRTGYRLPRRDPELADADRSIPDAGSSPVDIGVSRRRLVSGGAAAVAALAGGGWWWIDRRTQDSRFGTWMERGEHALRLDEFGAQYFQQATAIEPDNALAWGMLAYALAAGEDSGSRSVTGGSAKLVERAARRALQIDPDETNAILAMTIVQSDMLDWLAREGQYRRLLEIDPGNTRVMRWLGHLLHGVGRCREALALSDRALAIAPLTPDHQLRKAMRLWVVGRVAEADPLIDRAMELWPSHRVVRMARLMIYAFTGRHHAALAMVEEEEQHNVRLLSPAAVSVWRLSLGALESPSAAATSAAREANIEGARSNPAVAAWAILMLSALGDLDAAFDVANGFLLGRGSVIVRPRSAGTDGRAHSMTWRNTLGLFTPPAQAMRVDPRFAPLAHGLGLTDYWRRRGIAPDAFLFDTQRPASPLKTHRTGAK